MGCPFVTLGTEVVNHDNLLSAKARDLMKRYCRYFEGALREAHANRDPDRSSAREGARTVRIFDRIDGPDAD